LYGTARSENSPYLDPPPATGFLKDSPYLDSPPVRAIPKDSAMNIVVLETADLRR
jgi:hypothetical protein